MATATSSVFTPEEQRRVREKVIEEKIANELYLRHHPEVGLILSEAIRQVLKRRPKEPVAFIDDFFATKDLKELHRKLVAEQSGVPNLKMED